MTHSHDFRPRIVGQDFRPEVRDFRPLPEPPAEEARVPKVQQLDLLDLTEAPTDEKAGKEKQTAQG